MSPYDPTYKALCWPIYQYLKRNGWVSTIQIRHVLMLDPKKTYKALIHMESCGVVERRPTFTRAVEWRTK